MRCLMIFCVIAATTALDIGGYTYNNAAASPSLGQPSLGINHNSINYNSPVNSPQTLQVPHHEQNTVYEKEFYTYSAPEEEFIAPIIPQQGSSVSKKNLQVVFIHTPEQTGINRAVQHLAQQTLEQQTAIYVLSKQPDLSQLTQSLKQEINNVVHKPEVHFIKYRTQEDATNAQQSIRAHYENLGGQSHQAAHSVAPVLNFASQQSHSGHEISPQVQGNAPVPAQNYLPIRL